MNDKKRSLRMRNFADTLLSKGFGGLKSSFYIPPLKPLDLSNRTITDIDLQGKTNFKNAKFTGSILNDVTFKDIDLTGADFLKATLNSVTFESCILTGVNFTEANLYTKIIKSSGNTEDSEYTYIYTSFVNIDKFNNALFKKAKLYGVTFKNCNLTKADFSEAVLTVISYEDEDEDEYIEEYTVFDKVNLKEANFTSADLYSVSFINNVNLRKANFTKAILTYLVLDYFDVFLEDTLFVGALIRNVNFLNANYFGDPENEDIDDGSNILSGLNFSDATLEDVNLSYLIFENVTFSNAYLLNVNLAYSDLKNAEFFDCSLDYFSFDGANLENAYFNNCLLYNSSFNKDTKFGVNSGVSEDVVDTRTIFSYCIIYTNDIDLFLSKVSIIQSFINDDYIAYL
jgi:uncharacterized protein YjbI with pentapeptide repeats